MVCQRRGYQQNGLHHTFIPNFIRYTCTSAIPVGLDLNSTCIRIALAFNNSKKKGRPFQDHLGGSSPGVPKRLHQVVAFLEQNFKPEQVSYAYLSCYTLRTFLIHVKKGEQSLYLMCEKRASNIGYKSGLFAEKGMVRTLFGEDESDSESESGYSDS